MKINIETERLKLINFTDEMISNEYLSWLNDKSLMKFSEQRHKTHDFDSSLKYLNSFKGSDNLFLGIFTKENNILIGTLTAYLDKHNSVVDFGILIGSSKAKSKGYGLEAWKALTEFYLKFPVRKITAGTMASNKGMIAICEKAGMKLESVKKDHFVYRNELQDLYFFSRFNDQI